VLLIDQAEELWTLAPNEREAQASLLSQQRAFIQQILGALRAPNSPLLLLFTMRADFLHRAAEHPQLARAIGEHLVLVSPMTTDELRLAITQPAEAAGGSFDPGLVGELIEQTENRPDALPLLEYTLLELWNNKRPDGTMTWDAFRALGGVEGALEARADAVFSTHYPAGEQQEQVRKILLRLIQPGEGAADTRRRVRLDDLTSGDGTIADVQSLLAPLTDERLLTSGYDASSGAETIEIAHEALIRTWRTFNTWIAEAREDLRLQILLEDAAREWQHSGEKPDFLWGGLRLANAEAWLERVRPGLNPRDKRFLEACRFEELQRQEAEAAARARAGGRAATPGSGSGGAGAHPDRLRRYDRAAVGCGWHVIGAPHGPYRLSRQGGVQSGWPAHPDRLRRRYCTAVGRAWRTPGDPQRAY
jgi:hypothetical protein